MEIFGLRLFTVILIYLAIYDLKKGIIPNRVVYPSIIISLILSILSPVTNALLSLLSGIVLAVLLLVAGLLQKKMGLGDVKLAFLIGIMTGLPGGIIALFSGIFLGGLAAIFLLLFKLKGRKDEMPFAPFLAMGAIIVLLGSQYIVDPILKML
ncbi:MAG: A24 family peptidase [Dehalococcoidales bacterium]